MIISFPSMLYSVALCACSFSDTAQRINVDYNSTIEGITNELTLLNIVRAKDGLPLHYTSVQRLTGSFTLKATGGFNAQVKAAAPTDLTSSTTAASLTNIISRSVLSGGNIYTPSIGGEANTGPSFDVNILDTQNFYQGILASIPFSTINNFLLQGYDSKWLISLLAERIDFRLKQATPGFSKPKGAILRTIRNNGAVGTDADFARLISCYNLTGGYVKPSGTSIAPLSRVTSSRGNQSLTLQDLALLDGAKLELSGAVPSDPLQDVGITVIRPAARQEVAQLSRSPDCTDPEKTINGRLVSLPSTPPAEPPYVGSGQVMVLADDGRSGILVDADITVTFRSTEGLFQFVGRCLNGVQANDPMLCRIGDQELFALHKGSSPEALVSTNILGDRYYVARDKFSRSTMAVISLLERLINLQKSSIDRPVTVPVQVVP